MIQRKRLEERILTSHLHHSDKAAISQATGLLLEFKQRQKRVNEETKALDLQIVSLSKQYEVLASNVWGITSEIGQLQVETNEQRYQSSQLPLTLQKIDEMLKRLKSEILKLTNVAEDIKNYINKCCFKKDSEALHMKQTELRNFDSRLRDIQLLQENRTSSCKTSKIRLLEIQKAKTRDIHALNGEANIAGEILKERRFAYHKVKEVFMSKEKLNKELGDEIETANHALLVLKPKFNIAKIHVLELFKHKVKQVVKEVSKAVNSNEIRLKQNNNERAARFLQMQKKYLQTLNIFEQVYSSESRPIRIHENLSKAECFVETVRLSLERKAELTKSLNKKIWVNEKEAKHMISAKLARDHALQELESLKAKNFILVSKIEKLNEIYQQKKREESNWCFDISLAKLELVNYLKNAKQEHNALFKDEFNNLKIEINKKSNNLRFTLAQLKSRLERQIKSQENKGVLGITRALPTSLVLKNKEESKDVCKLKKSQRSLKRKDKRTEKKPKRVKKKIQLIDLFSDDIFN